MKNAVVLLSLCSIGLTACDGQVRFNQIDLGSKQSIIEPVVASGGYAKTQGACASDSSTSVVSCLKCDIPQLPPVEPPMSLKAKQLMNIMTAVCPINNSYYGNQYVTPTLADHKAKLNRCSTLLYPDSIPDTGQNDVVQRLLNGDTSLQNLMFTGLWYQPPYSDYFETYFGLKVGQAIQVFCSQTVSNISLGLTPSMTRSNPYGPVYQVGDPLPTMYVLANQYRTGLMNCINESKTNPWQAPAPAAAKQCNYETLSGANGDPINSQVSSWLTQGYSIGADLKGQNLCVSVKSVDDLKSYQGDITVGAYICQ